MQSAVVVERTLAAFLKPRGYRKRARNWFRQLPACDYQVINLQRSIYGSGNCYLNLGWHVNVPAGVFLLEYKCMIRSRAERTGVIAPIIRYRPDGESKIELPGISLLDDTELDDPRAEAAFVEELTSTVVTPVADFMDKTSRIDDLVPFLTAQPSWVTRDGHDELGRRGFELPTVRQDSSSFE